MELAVNTPLGYKKKLEQLGKPTQSQGEGAELHREHMWTEGWSLELEDSCTTCDFMMPSFAIIVMQILEVL